MFRPRPLHLLSVLLFYSAFGDIENVGKSEIIEDFMNGNSRKDAEQDPLTSVTLAAGAGDAHSTLFGTCLAKSRTFEARFASIEVVPGSEYIRYVLDSLKSLSPISWMIVTGKYASILDCAQAAHDGNWSTFKYNDSTCEVVNSTFKLDDVPKCEEENSDAVFLLSTALIVDRRFIVAYDNNKVPQYGLIDTTLMTYAEAKSYCTGAYPNNAFRLFVNRLPPQTEMQNAVVKLTALGYTKANLWVDPDEYYFSNFKPTDWWNGAWPPLRPANAPPTAAYMDKDTNLKLRASDKTLKVAGAFCITNGYYSPEG